MTVEASRHYFYRNIQDYYNQRYSGASEVTAKKKELAFLLLKQKYRDPKSVVVLDLGCGTGVYTSKIAEAGFQVEGVDVSDVAIQQLQLKGIQGKVLNVNDPLPFSDSSCDVVWATDLLEMVQDIFNFLWEVHRVLVPGGILLFTCPHSAWLPWRLLHLAGCSCSDLQPMTHVRFWTRRGLRRYLCNEFFQLEALYGIVNVPLVFTKLEFTSSRLNILSRDIVGIARRL